MDKTLYDITTIETIIFDKLVSSGVNSKNIFLSNRPDSLDKNVDYFYVIRMSTPISDKDAIGVSIISIDLYVKDIRNLRNSIKLSEMYRNIVGLLPYSKDNYSFMYNGSTPSYSDKVGFHYQIVNIKLIINQ